MAWRFGGKGGGTRPSFLLGILFLSMVHGSQFMVRLLVIDRYLYLFSPPPPQKNQALKKTETPQTSPIPIKACAALIGALSRTPPGGKGGGMYVCMYVVS